VEYLWAGCSGEFVIWRDSRFFGSVLLPIHLLSAERRVFRKRGVYLLVGGAGRVGRELSLLLAERFQARLVWLGRRELDEKLRSYIDKIESAGGEVLYLQADVTESDSLCRAVRETKVHWGEIHGVFHAAVALEDASLDQWSAEGILRVLEPKTLGTCVLVDTLRNEGLDFFVFLSSIQSFLGDKRQAAYAIGCGFQDTFSRVFAKSARFPVRTINFGYWGGGESSEDARSFLSAIGYRAIPPVEGLEAIITSVASPETQVVMVKADEDVLASLGVDFGRRVKIVGVNRGLEQALPASSTPPLAQDQLENIRCGSMALERLGRVGLLAAFQRMSVSVAAVNRLTWWLCGNV